MATALEAYHADHGAYPPWTTAPEEKAMFPGAVPLPSFRRHMHTDSSILTTPTAYIHGLLADTSGHIEYVSLKTPAATARQHTFAYWAPTDTAWILISAGPNRRFDLDYDTLRRAYDVNTATPTALLLSLTYDPTNGSRSAGDLWLARPKGGKPDQDSRAAPERPARTSSAAPTTRQ